MVDIINYLREFHMGFFTSTRRVQRVRHDLRLREVEVRRVTPVSANFISVVFGGESLADFRSDGFDDHIKFMFNDAAGQPVRRDYTPRHFDRAARELTLEFALHEGGAASDWAAQARVGQKATIGGPRGSMVVPINYHWHLLIGDSTALPAIHRRLEELTASTCAIAVIQVTSEADCRPLSSRADLQVHWVYSPGDLVAATRSLTLPKGEGYAWAAGEASVMKTVRQVLVDEHRQPGDALHVAAYWKRGQADFHERL